MTSVMKRFPLLLVTLVIIVGYAACKTCVHNCGDKLCCCDNNTAYCQNKDLTYIPKLPVNIEAVTLIGKFPVLSSEILKPISHLKIRTLRVLSSRVSNLTTNVFTSLAYLGELDLSGNENLNVFQLARSFYSIQRNHNFSLILNKCQLMTLETDFFKGLESSNITNITMRHNRMKEFYISKFLALKTLKHLDLSVNWIKDINFTGNDYGMQSNLETLTLANNEFYLFPPPLCDNKSIPVSPLLNLKNLDFSNNFITVPRAQDWYCLKKLEMLNLSRNAVQILENDVFYDLSALKRLELSHMLRTIDKIYPRAFNSSSLTELRFQNNVQVFKPGSDVKVEKLFISLPNLKILYLGGNNLNYLKDKLVDMLSPLNHLQEICLRHTELQKIPDGLLANFKNLSKLYLDVNKIERIDASAFANVTKLKYLDLSGNKLKEITPESFPDSVKQSLIEIDLSGNPFACDECSGDNLWFRNWIDREMKRGKTFIGWPEKYMCNTPVVKSNTLLRDYRPSRNDCKSNEMLVAYITIAVFMCFVIIFGIAGYRGRWYIRYWFIKFIWKFKPREPSDDERQTLLQEEEVVYDAYVIYHDADRSFVREKLLPLMEEQFQYKLFIRDREPEFIGAKVDIMVESIYKSKHVIAVISKRFLRDQWCEFQLAVTIDRQVEIKRNYLLLVSLEDFEKRLLSKSWCVLFTKTPTAEWCDRKNDIKRKVFERQIQTTILNTRFPRQLSHSSETGDSTVHRVNSANNSLS